MKKVLQLSTYPIKNSLHGGQIRVSEIRKFLENHGCTVKSISISENSHIGYTEDDLIINPEDANLLEIPFCGDYATSISSVKGKYFNFIKNKFYEFNPDLVFLEQPWLWLPVKLIIDKLVIKPKIIYSSQNVEYMTKKNLLASNNIFGENVDCIIKNIYELEKDICNNADYIIACTKNDAEHFKQEFNCDNFIIANNGVSDRSNLEYDNFYFDQNQKFILFVGSAYPPNAQGFWEILGPSIAFLPPEYHIYVVGGVADILESFMPKDYLLYSHVSLDRIKRIGMVSEDLLNSLINYSSLIILPITTGGGSNLKTAEAIASFKPVVATKVACRGFHDYVDKLSNFLVANSKDEFMNNMLYLLENANVKNLTKDELKIRENVYWCNTLKDISLLID